MQQTNKKYTQLFSAKNYEKYYSSHNSILQEKNLIAFFVFFGKNNKNLD